MKEVAVIGNSSVCVVSKVLRTYTTYTQGENHGLKTCGSMLGLVNPQAAFHACMGLIHDGGHVVAHEILSQCSDHKDEAIASVEGFSIAAKTVASVVELTDFWNKDHLTPCLLKIGELMDTKRLLEEFGGELVTDSEFVYDWKEGTVEIR